MIKIRILSENFITEQEKITLSQIVGDNSVISFDFDNTLVKSFTDFDVMVNLFMLMEVQIPL